MYLHGSLYFSCLPGGESVDYGSGRIEYEWDKNEDEGLRDEDEKIRYKCR